MSVSALTPERLLDELRARGALLEGHFRLSSGRHSNRFVQKFRFLEDPALLERIVAALLAKHAAARRDVASSRPRSAASCSATKSARQLGTRAIFVEKEAGTPRFRRGFGVAPGERVLVVEDVITTGLSVREVIDVVDAEGGVVAAAGVVVRRSAVDVGAPLFALLDLPMDSYEAGRLPAMCGRRGA